MRNRRRYRRRYEPDFLTYVVVSLVLMPALAASIGMLAAYIF